VQKWQLRIGIEKWGLAWEVTLSRSIVVLSVKEIERMIGSLILFGHGSNCRKCSTFGPQVCNISHYLF